MKQAPKPQPPAARAEDERTAVAFTEVRAELGERARVELALTATFLGVSLAEVDAALVQEEVGDVALRQRAGQRSGAA